LILYGAPGSGKGTQADFLRSRYGIPHISTGDILRTEMAAKSELGSRVKEIYDRGDLVPDGIMIEIIKGRLRQADCERGFILDGFPRTIAQADGLASMLQKLGQKLDGAIYFDVSQPELVRRLTGRRLCRQCQTPYHLVSAPPARSGVCDKCGGELYQRQDDDEATVLNRLQVYERQTAPLLDYYRSRGLLRTVSGEGAVEKIRQALRDAAGAPR
jgi:adenylate kinase